MKQLRSYLSVIFCAIVVSGCSTTLPSAVYSDPSAMGGVSLALNDHDYDLAAEGIAKELMSRSLPKGYTVVLGPVDTRDCKYDVQMRTLQKSLQVIFNKEGSLQFSAAVDSIGAGGSAAEEIYKLIEYNYFVGNPMDAEELAKFGRISKVSGILFGRVSCIEHKVGRTGKEVTYRFVWELADTRSGLVKLSHEKKIRKTLK